MKVLSTLSMDYASVFSPFRTLRPLLSVSLPCVYVYRAACRFAQPLVVVRAFHHWAAYLTHRHRHTQALHKVGQQTAWTIHVGATHICICHSLPINQRFHLFYPHVSPSCPVSLQADVSLAHHRRFSAIHTWRHRAKHTRLQRLAVRYVDCR